MKISQSVKFIIVNKFVYLKINTYFCLMKKENIELLSYLKNNETWFVPENKNILSLEIFDKFEVIHYHNDNNFLVFAWMDNDKLMGRLFKAKLK